MDPESISNKLSELLELHKSGAITKEEFETLKKQILSNEGIKPVEPEKEQDMEPVKPPEEPLEVERAEPEEVTEEVPAEAAVEPTVAKKGKRIWIPAIISIVIIVGALLIFKAQMFKAKSVLTLEEPETVLDIDGNVYNTVSIGSQVWMAENLKTTTYNDGTPIPLVTEDSKWAKLTTPAYSWYKNDESLNKNTLGALYNGYTIETNKLCPAGWHVPTDSEWTTLTNYLSNNGYGFQGTADQIGKSMASTSGWLLSPTIGSNGNDQTSNNRSGFNGYASGIRFNDGSYLHRGKFGKWWSSTENSASTGQIRFISYDNGIVTSYSNGKRNGFSVRCVKD